MQRIAAILVGIILMLFVFIIGTAVIYYPGMISAVESIDQHWAALNKVNQEQMATLEQMGKPSDPASAQSKAYESAKALRACTINTEHAPSFAAQMTEYAKLYKAHQQTLMDWMIALEQKRLPEPAPEILQKLQQQIMQQSLERAQYNRAVLLLNQKANSFPVNLISGRLGFGARPEL